MMFALGLALLPLAGPVVQLHVDARDAARGIFHVRESVPAQGPLTLKIPKWIPGEHGPSGTVFDVVNIHFSQDGHELGWKHDPLDLFSIRVDSASGPVEARFDYVAPRNSVASRNLARVKWNRLVMLPDGKAATVIAPSIEIPPGWTFSSALDWDHSGVLETTTAERLIDSPGVMGAYYQSFRIDSKGQPPASLEVYSEKPAPMPADMVEGHRRLYSETLAMFGAPHFRHYQFLLTFSDHGGSEGLEHNECSEDGLPFEAITNAVNVADLDAHEFVHSWCGKYRRPAGLSKLDFDQPMSDEDLWVYEGFTQFAGAVLAARSGMWSAPQFLGRVASSLAWEESMTGRGWRSLEDTAVFGSLINIEPDAWLSRRRGSDYYEEMLLVWLEADGILRRESGGKKSIDDFAAAFFGGANRGVEIRPFSREELFRTLDAVVAYDWPGFFAKRVFMVRPKISDGWLERAGYRFIQNEKPNPYLTAFQVGDVTSSYQLDTVGLIVTDGEIRDVQEGSAADKGRLAPGMKMVAVDGVKFSVAVFEEAIQRHAQEPAPMELIIDDNDLMRTVSIDFHGGLKSPHLERLDQVSDLLLPLIATRA